MYIAPRIAPAFAVASLLAFASAAVAAPPAEVFGGIEAMTDPELSPDGKHLAAIEPVNGHPTIIVFALDAPPGTPAQSFGVPEVLPNRITWVSDDRLVGEFSFARVRTEGTGRHLRQFERSVSISLSGGAPFTLLQGSQAARMTESAVFAGLDPAAGGRVLMYAYNYSGQETTDTRFSQSYYNLNLYSVNVDDGSFRQVDQGNENTERWIIGRDGQPVARIDSNADLKGDLYVRDGSSWRKAYTIDESAGVNAGFVGVSDDGKSLLVERYGSSDKLELQTFAMSGSTFGPALFSNPTYDVEGEIVDPWTGSIVGVSYAADKTESQYFQPDLAKVQKSVEAALPGETVEIRSWDKARDRYIVATETPREPTIYNLFTPANGRLTALASQYPALTTSDLGDMKPYNYTARDGTAIHAYLTLPPGKTGKNLPTVIFPHGGPDYRDRIGFDWWAQFMASRGYAVLQPNFRGSSGYGYAFTKAGFGQWGKAMQDDISDGVKKLIADGIADPKRICIVGASYGGYAALAGATFTPDLYACAVSFAGVADTSTMIGDTIKVAGANSPAVSFWESRIGDIFYNEAALKEISPALHASQVSAPILLIHCTNDLTVPIVQSEIEQAALQKAGKSVNFVRIDGDDHYIRQSATRIQVLKEIETFLQAHIGN